MELLYDRDRATVGLRPIEQRAENAYQVRRPASSPGGPWVISAMAFTKFYDIGTAVTTRWVAYLDTGVLCADLTSPGTTVGNSRRPR